MLCWPRARRLDGAFFMQKVKSLLPILVLAAAAGVLAGCGGGGGSSASLKPGDVAVVGSTHVTKSAFDALMAQAQRSFQQQGRTFPKPGTTNYETVKGNAVSLLVQQAMREEKAASMGITISAQAVSNRLDQIKKQYFSGSEAKYQAQLKKSNLTDAQVREDIKAQLISEAVFNKVTANVTVSNSDVHSYYVSHQSLYSQPPTVDVRHILVKSKSLADSIYAQLKAGNDKTWCTLAKKYSQDPSSKDNCGKLTVSQGQTVPVFNQIAFGSKQGVVNPPVHDPTYGYFVIEVLSKVHPAAHTPEKQVAASIQQQLLQQKKNQVMTTWVNSLAKDFCGGTKIKYQLGYQATPDPCAATTSLPTTT